MSKQFYSKQFSSARARSLTIKTILFQTIQFSIQKQFHLKQFSLVKVRSLNVKAVLFQTIQFRISAQFSSIWLTDRTLSGATTPGQSGPGSDGNEEVLPPKLQHYWDLNIRYFKVISRILIRGFCPSAGNQSVYSTAPTDRANLHIVILILVHSNTNTSAL